MHSLALRVVESKIRGRIFKGELGKIGSDTKLRVNLFTQRVLDICNKLAEGRVKAG